MKREITRIITPGTVIDSTMLPSAAATYLMALCPETKGHAWGIALLDITTGEFFVSLVEHDANLNNLLSEIARYCPRECIIPSTVPDALVQRVSERGVVVSRFRDEAFTPGYARKVLTSHFHVQHLPGLAAKTTRQPLALQVRRSSMHRRPRGRPFPISAALQPAHPPSR